MSAAEREAAAQRRREEEELAARKRELEEMDRDTRTVFAYNISTKADEMAIFKFFSKAGKVLDVRVIYDRNTSRSKGLAYVEMENKSMIPAVLALSGQELNGHPVMIKSSEAEKNIAWEAQQQQKAAAVAKPQGVGVPPPGGLLPPHPATLGPGPCKLYVGNLHTALGDDDLKSLFEPFGAIDSIEVTKDLKTGVSLGFAFVVYKATADAMQAAQQLNNMDLAGQQMKVTLAQDQPPRPLPPPPPGMPGAFPPGVPGGLQPGMPPGLLPQVNLQNGTLPAQTAAAAALVAAAANAMAPAAELDDEGDGVRLDSRSRAALMQRLARNDDPLAANVKINPLTGQPLKPGEEMPQAQLPVAAQPITQGLLGAPSPIPTECVLLKNMFDPAEETEENWWLDIEEDVKEECGRFGQVLHTFVDKTSQGFVYVRFATVDAAKAAQQALHSRWFAKRRIAAEYQFTKVYEAYFA